MMHYAATRGRGWALGLEVVCLRVRHVSLLILAMSAMGYKLQIISSNLRVANRRFPP